MRGVFTCYALYKLTPSPFLHEHDEQKEGQATTKLYCLAIEAQVYPEQLVQGVVS